MSDHIKYMQRCLELAEKGLGSTAPNPMVGAVIVCNGKIIGEGYHKQYGQPHAEVNAIESVSDKSLLTESAMYVSLEPCCHFGKTPPCTSLIIDMKIPEIIIAMRDPNPKVAGKGIEILKNSGVKITEDICTMEAEFLNRRFISMHKRQRPWIILKWAQSDDGFIDIIPRNTSPHINWISNPYSRKLVHKWRSEESGILVGKNTAINDNPSLTTREWPGKNPVRFLIDPGLATPFNYNIFNTDAHTVCFYDQKTILPDDRPEYIQFVPLNFNTNIAKQIMKHVYDMQINSIIIEGGR